MSVQTKRPIHIQYYAVLREERGESRETWLTDAATPRAVYAELQARYGFRLNVPQMRVAINEVFGEWDTPLSADDTLVFIPPVAGG